MNLEDAKKEVLRKSKKLLEKNSSGKGYICPICSFGMETEDGKGITLEPDNHFTCPNGCYENATIIEIMGIKLTTHKEDDIIRAVSGQLNIEVENIEKEIMSPADMLKGVKQPKNIGDGHVDYTYFFEECLENINKCHFLETKKIGKDIQRRFGIGFCDDWIHPETREDMVQYVKPTPRLIIPTSKNSYAAVYTGNEKNMINNIQRTGLPILFNAECLYVGEDAVFIVDNEMDALSVIECGYDAIAVGGFKHIKVLYDALMEQKTNRIITICMDESKEEKQQEVSAIKEELEKIGQDFIVYNIAGEYDSPFEAMQKDKAVFEENIENAIMQTYEYQIDKVKEYQEKNSNSFYLNDFKNGINSNTDTPYLVTGFEELDRVLDGGLYEGLYVIGSKNSVGKTTLALQIADNIASFDNNIDVLIFSFETARNELIAKSISRTTAQLAIKNKKPLKLAKTSREITIKAKYYSYNDEERRLIKDSCTDYGKYAGNIFIHECSGTIGALELRELIEAHLEKIKKVGRKLIVVIDYLEIMSAFDEVQKDEMNITEIKRISRDHKMPILAVSASNLDNYKSEGDITELNKRDAIERSSDVLLAMHLKDDVDKIKDENSNKKPIKVEITVLKNRNGKTGDVLNLAYFPPYNIFDTSSSK